MSNLSKTTRHLTVRSALIMLLLVIGWAQAAAAEPDRLWTDVAEAGIARTSAERQIIPLAYRSVQLDRDQLASLLSQVPLESTVPAIESRWLLSLPLADGRFSQFSIAEAPVMEPALAAKFPEIRTYIGQGIDDRSATLRFDVTPTGFHAQIISWEGSTYIDPYQPGDLDHYIVYRKRDAQEVGERPRCLVTEQELPKDAPNFQKRNQAVKVSSGASLRTYRVAIAATGEYTAFHGGTVAGGLAAIVTTLNRVVGIYERDLSVRMTLVANNSLIVYTNAGTDPYDNNDGFAMLTQNQNNLDTVIGTANYDIGHVVSTGGGGVAGLGVVCNAGAKGQGVTGLGSPVGDPFDVDYVSHEIGHQFAGSHTFNSNAGSCGGNRSATSAYEVGSGLTIQAYAGICPPDNLQNNSAPYFHRRSLNQMLAFTTNAGSGASCGVATATGNTPPTVSTPAAFTIPRSTPFTLTASGNDVDGDSITYLWEEFDLGPANVAGTLSDNGGPLFRNYSPVTSPSRTFPSLQYILNNANVPPQTTGSFLTGELLPSTNRTMNFRVTARDNRAAGGGTNEASTAITINAASGPFAVTSPNTAVTLDATQPQTITWNVAGTNAAPVNTATVTISLSLDGGNTFPLTLATGEANDGSATLNLAGATPTTQARIRVAAENNIYFDISDTNFTITGTGGTFPVLSNTAQQLLTGNQVIEPNECNQLSITLSNSGTATATGISAVLSTSTPNVGISQPNAGFADIPAGENRTSQTPFEISTGGALVCFGDVDLTLTVTYGGGGSPYVSNFSLPVGQAASGGNYSFASSTGATIPAGGTLVAGSQGDDAVFDLTVPAGFNFSVYGTTVSAGATLRASTNGNLQIVDSGGSASFSNTALPTAGVGFPAALPVLMPYWDDLDTRNSTVVGGGIYEQVTGIAPNRKWIIEWRGEQLGNNSSAISVNFAIEFNEASSEFAYIYALTDGSNANGAGATIGVQSATTGTTFTQFSFNSASVAPGQRLTATLPAGICSAGTGPCGGATGVTIVESGGTTDVTEGSGNDTYTVVLDSEPSADVTISITPDAQVSANPTSLTFTAANWDVVQEVTVTAVDDGVVEGTHSGTLSHSAAGGGYGAVSIADVVASITDNDTATVTTGSIVEAEGDSGNTPVQLTLQLAGQVAGGFTVNYQTRDGSAVAGQDYVGASGSITFDGSANATRQLTIDLLGDTVPEADEQFFVDLSTTAGPAVQVTPAAVSIDITNDDLSADLLVTHQRNAGPTAPGDTVSYSVTVLNQSAVIDVPNTTFSYALDAALSNPEFSCSSMGSATCPASGSGAISHNIVLPAGGSVSYSISAVILANTPIDTSVSTTASATVQAPYSDPNTGNNSVPVQFTVLSAPQPILNNASQQLLTGNQVIEPYECNQLSITLSNSGTATATGISAVLSTSTPNVSISQPNAGFADIPAGENRTSQTPFEISTGGALVCFGDVDLTLTVTYGGGGSPYVSNFSLPVGQAASGGNYSFASSTGATIPAGGTLVAGSQGDDELFDLTVPAGFNFSVYGTTVSAGSILRASTNGTLQIVDSGGSREWFNSSLPSAGTHNGLGSFPAAMPVLMPYWDDLDMRVVALADGGIYQHVTGTAPNRKWIIEWRGEEHNNVSGAISVNFAIEFNEASSEFSYIYALTDGSNANGAGATIGVQSATTGTTFTQFSFNSASVAPGQRLTATLPAGICSAGTGTCGGAPGVTIAESGGTTDVTEGSGNDTYTVVLDSEPSADVTISITPGAQVSANPTSLIFTAANWNVVQQVTVTAVDDGVVEGTHSGTLTHSAAGGAYDAVSIADVVAIITDNDTATVTTGSIVEAEGDSGNTPVQLTLQLAGQVAGGFTVTYQTRDGTAVAGQDYVGASGSVAFDGSANATRQLTIDLVGDTVPEADEQLFVDLSTTAGPAVQVTPATVSIDIINDDLAADLRVTHQRDAGPTGPGDTVSYSVTVLNQSAVIDVPNTTFSYALDAALSNPEFSCSSIGGATCPVSGSGTISHSIELPAGSSVSYSISAVILPNTPVDTSVSTTASATVQAPFSDPNTGNNSVPVQFTVDANSDAVFADGFE